MQSTGPIISLLRWHFFWISKALCFNEHCSVSVMYMLFIEVSLISNRDRIRSGLPTHHSSRN